MGYAGGTTPSPTYHHLGDHTETIEIDYDPRVLTYDDLLAVFFDSHNPTHVAVSVQYRSAVFYRTPAEREAAETAIERVRSSAGSAFTSVEPYSVFHSAEDYHQKYEVRRYPDLTREFMRAHSSDTGFRDSTAVARVNGWLGGCGSAAQIERDLPRTGLSDAAQALVRSRTLPGGRPRIGCGA